MRQLMLMVVILSLLISCSTRDSIREGNVSISEEHIDYQVYNDTSSYKEEKEQLTKTHNKTKDNSSFARQKETSPVISGKKLLPPEQDKIYFGAFPDFGGPEDNVTYERIEEFEVLAGKKITWAYFSNNWWNGIRYPIDAIHTIHDAGTVPFIRLMPRSDDEQYHEEKTYSLKNIIDGKFDEDLKRWAKDAKEDGIPLLVDFAVEMNGDWFSWSGKYNGQGGKTGYGSPELYDGPEMYRDAYKHIINIFRQEDVTHITWFFHADIYSVPDEEWNQPRYYYPGDEYIDWIGISIYGPQNPEEDYWEMFSEILKERHGSILDISDDKPIAILEFGVTDNHPLGKKEQWLQDAFETILNNPYIKFSAISYWNENWEEEDDLFATIRIDSSKKSLDTFRKYSQENRFVSRPIFSSAHEQKNTEKKNLSSWYKPRPKTTWQWQLGKSDKINIRYNVEMYDIDLAETPQDTIDILHKRGTKVICYFSGGSYENFRTDAKEFPKEVLGNKLDGWPDERWLDVSNYERFASIMQSRLDMAVKKRCDGVEPDNMDGYLNDNGFGLTYDDQLKYNIWLAKQAHARNLSIGLKNDLEQVKELVDIYDFSVNEECFFYDECDMLSPFINDGKAVFNVEYELKLSEFCEKAKRLRFSSLKMEPALDGNRISCN